jgi:tetratricopeptide (TPR) repeat protein
MAYNELGVIAFANESYEESSQLFYHALSLIHKLEFGTEPTDLGFVKDIGEVFWEPTINNLGHCFRRLHRFADAIFCHEAAYNLVRLPSTTSALAFARHLDGDVDYAIEGYHSALGENGGDQFAMDMLDKALEESATRGIDDLLNGVGFDNDNSTLGSSIGEGEGDGRRGMRFGENDSRENNEINMLDSSGEGLEISFKDQSSDFLDAASNGSEDDVEMEV